jgi:geranylgeranylglycerol-phosphate geranylgeranyltransferase
MKIIISSLIGLFQLCRPINVIVTAVVVVVGGVIAAKQASVTLPSVIYLAGLSAALIAAAGNVINDVYDLKIDRINRPKRPLPSGKTGVIPAVIWSIMLSLTGILLGLILSSSLGIIAIIVSLLLWGYSFKLKRLPLIGNIVVSISGGLAFIYGAVAVSEIKYGIFPASFALLIHLSREIIKDAEDMPGDRAVDARTLPLVVGKKISLQVAVIPLLILIGLTIVPYQLNIFGLNYLLLVVAIVDLPLLILMFFLIVKWNTLPLMVASQALKILMITGLVALWFG